MRTPPTSNKMKCALLLLFTLFGDITAQFGSQGQADILNVHNTLRSSVAKGTYVAKGTTKKSGSNITKMKWDATVAASAQKYAETCPTGHSHTPGLGENLYWSWTSASVGDLNIYGSKASSSWEKEFQDFGWTSNNFTLDAFNSGIGHATQMAWAQSNLVGCGVKSCGPDPSVRNLNKVAVVCQYKPAGNTIGTLIYTEGPTCSVCPSGTSCEQSSGLCV